MKIKWYFKKLTSKLFRCLSACLHPASDQFRQFNKFHQNDMYILVGPISWRTRATTIIFKPTKMWSCISLILAIERQRKADISVNKF